MDKITPIPNEIILQFFAQLPSDALVACSATCRKFHTLAADQNLWRQLCLDDFGEWDKRHNLPNLLRGPSESFDWKALYITRCGIHRNTQRALDTIVSSQYGRLDKARSLIAYGVDIRDVLIKNINSPEPLEDVLARQWYARLLLGRLQREQAVNTWRAVAAGEDVGLVETLHAFDLFVRREHAPSITEMRAELRRHATACRDSVHEWDELSTRHKAIVIARYLQENELVGIRPPRSYSDLRNSFIGNALFAEDHSSLQLISTAIYCGVAEILGLEVKPCGFPGHVLAIVYPKPGLTLDDTPMPKNQSSKDDNTDAPSYLCENWMYLDPYSTSKVEKPYSELVASLTQLGIHGEDIGLAMGPATNVEILRRSGRNIINAIQRPGSTIKHEESGIDNQTALYGALWAFLLLTNAETAGAGAVTQRQAYLPHFMQRFEHHFPFDVHLLVDMICPMYERAQDRQVIRNHLRDAMGADSIPRPVKSRNGLAADQVKYRIGQIFTHAKYDYKGLIYGWDPVCTASDDWVANMSVNDLERGKQQSFYHTFSADGSLRYVAEDNINVITPSEPPEAILKEAGQWFKRWDSSKSMFVSNISDEYPDD